MPSIINLSPIWEHTLTEILNHGNKTDVGMIMRSWVKYNGLEDMNELLIHDLMISHLQAACPSTNYQQKQKKLNQCQLHL